MLVCTFMLCGGLNQIKFLVCSCGYSVRCELLVSCVQCTLIFRPLCLSETSVVSFGFVEEFFV